jgi:hypothetical protein
MKRYLENENLPFMKTEDHNQGQSFAALVDASSPKKKNLSPKHI